MIQGKLLSRGPLNSQFINLAAFMSYHSQHLNIPENISISFRAVNNRALIIVSGSIIHIISRKKCSSLGGPCNYALIKRDITVRLIIVNVNNTFIIACIWSLRAILQINEQDCFVKYWLSWFVFFSSQAPSFCFCIF